ncbi:MAG: glucose-6-phosphate isomerase [Thermovirgaceae bacterium]
MDILELSYGGAFPGGSKNEGKNLARIFDELEDSLKLVQSQLEEGVREKKDGFGWVLLPEEHPNAVLETADRLNGYDAVVQIGIGGSALGNLMLQNALVHPYYNELSRGERGGPRFYMADNADPEGTSAIWEMIDPDRTAFIVVSKSGTTAETMANFLWFWNRISRKNGKEAAKQVTVVTDPERGVLRSFAKETGCHSLVIPPGVGGRYSVLSAVGLLSAACQGIDVRRLLGGASAMRSRIIAEESLAANPAWILAACGFTHAKAGRNMMVLMPYADCLLDFTEWFAQLWAESLGKDGKGSTPVRALGAIDQHSQVQLYTSGPDDKLFLLMSVDERDPLYLPECHETALEPLSYLSGKTMGGMLNSEALATTASLIKAKRPVLWMRLPKIDAFRMGGLIYLFEYATALAGGLMEINPFDQPGVEQGKRYTYGLMGKRGFEEDAREAEKFFKKALARTLKV